MEANTFKISKQSQRLQHVASKDKTRPMMSGVYFNGSSVVATDGHCMVIAPKSEGEPDNQILKFSKPDLKNESEEYQLLKVGDKAIGLFDSKNTAETVQCDFPGYQQAVPEIQGEARLVSFNVELLAKMVKAMGSNHVVLRITDNDTAPIPVIVGGTECAVGILMPMKHDATDEDFTKRFDKALGR